MSTSTPTRLGGSAPVLPEAMVRHEALSRRSALGAAAAVALGLASISPTAARAPAPPFAIVMPASPDAALIQLARRVEALAAHRQAATERVKRLELKVEAVHPSPPLPVTNDVYHAYHAEARPTEERIGLVQLRKVRRRMAERLNRWIGKLAAMQPSTSAGLSAKAAAVLAIGDLHGIGGDEGAERLIWSVLNDVVRLGAGGQA